MRLDLKVRLLKCDITQRALAHKLGIAESRLSAIVRGWSDPTVAEREAISTALDASCVELFGEPAERGRR